MNSLVWDMMTTDVVTVEPSAARELMTAPPATVPATATVAEARRMHAAGIKRQPVVDEDGRLLGIVSRADLLKVFATTAAATC